MEQLVQQQSASLTQAQASIGKLEKTSLELHTQTQQTLGHILTRVDEAPHMSAFQFEEMTAILRRIEAKLNGSSNHQITSATNCADSQQGSIPQDSKTSTVETVIDPESNIQEHPAQNDLSETIGRLCTLAGTKKKTATSKEAQAIITLRSY